MEVNIYHLGIVTIFFFLFHFFFSPGPAHKTIMPGDRYMPAEDTRHSAAELRLVKFNEGKRIKKPLSMG